MPLQRRSNLFLYRKGEKQTLRLPSSTFPMKIHVSDTSPWHKYSQTDLLVAMFGSSKTTTMASNDNMPSPTKKQQEVLESTEVSSSNGSDAYEPSIELPPLPASLVRSMPKVYSEQLVPIDLSFGMVREEKSKAMNVKEANNKAIKERHFSREVKASVCLLIRKPGCVICCEQGNVLSEIVSSFAENQVAGWGVIKEINVDDEGLLEMYQNHFRFPFFVDTKMKLYKAMGDRKLNILETLWYSKETRERVEKRGIAWKNNMLGEGLTLGGILVFDGEGQIRYAFKEQSGGQQFPFDQVRAAIRSLISEE